MRELFILIAHLLVTLAKLGTRGGLGAVAAESLAVKHQLLIMKRAQRRAPNLTSWDRLVLGVCALLVSPNRPLPGGDGPSWLTVIGHAKDSLWSVDFLSERIDSV